MSEHSLRATVAYDGTEFLGFQVQNGGRTIQGVLETALAQVTRQTTRVVGAGRTDAGVHARGQVIGFRVEWRHTLSDLHRALNAVLPEDVAVLDLNPAQPGWHPRFSARRRHYRYTVLNSPLRSPLDRHYAHLVVEPLDLGALQSAADLLVGQHDFASFGQPTQGEVTIRNVHRAFWQQAEHLLLFEIEANAFLRRMVRTIVGTLLEVGTGRQSVTSVAEILAATDRSAAAPPAPACGLCLVEVKY